MAAICPGGDELSSGCKFHFVQSISVHTPCVLYKYNSHPLPVAYNSLGYTTIEWIFCPVLARTDIKNMHTQWIIHWVWYFVISDKFMMNTTNTGVMNENSTVAWGEVVVFSITSFATLTGNILVIIAVLRFRFMRTPTNVFVAGLACLDVGMGIITLTLTVQSIAPSLMNKRLPCLAKVTFSGVSMFSTAMMLAGTVNHLLGDGNALCVCLSLKVSICLQNHLSVYVNTNRDVPFCLVLTTV